MSDKNDGFVPNPVLAGLVGICPLVVASRSLAEGAVYGLGAALCAIGLGAVVPALRGLIPERLQTPVSLALSAAFAMSFGLGLSLYSPTLALSLWIYLPLLAVSGLSLSALMRTSLPNRFGPDGKSRIAGISAESLLFLLTASFVGAIRELVGLGTLSLPSPGTAPIHISISSVPPLRILVSPAGGFILLGFLVAAYRLIVRSDGRKGA